MRRSHIQSRLDEKTLGVLNWCGSDSLNLLGDFLCCGSFGSPVFNNSASFTTFRRYYQRLPLSFVVHKSA